MNGKGNINEYLDRFMFDLKNIEGKGYIGMITGNHDIPRLAHGRSIEEVKTAMVFLFTMPGVPFVYYGDEIGMDYISGLKSKEGGYNRTGSRTPMQWDDRKNHGFSTTEITYLPTDNRDGAPTVAAQLYNRDSLLSFMKKLISYRRNTPALSPNADFEILNAGYPFTFIRSNGEQFIYIAINPSNTQFSLELQIDLDVMLNQNVAINDTTINMDGVSFLIGKIIDNK